MADTSQLTNKVALITGGARRVGREIALSLARAGMDVAITYNQSHDDAKHTVEKIRKLGRRAIAIAADNRDPRAAELIYQGFVDEFDHLHALINNASSFSPSPFGQITTDAYDAHMAVNARTPLLLTQLCAPLLAAHYHPDDPSSLGRVINFVDVHVLGEPLHNFLAYNASKAALLEITMSCAIELAPKITVNAVAPGVVDWPEGTGPEYRERYLKRVPLARAGQPTEAASAVVFLVRDGHYCTGQVIRVDGGRALS